MPCLDDDDNNNIMQFICCRCFRRTLRCTRIAIHVHLFISLALNNLSWIVWYKTVVEDLSVIQENGVSR